MVERLNVHEGNELVKKMMRPPIIDIFLSRLVSWEEFLKGLWYKTVARRVKMMRVREAVRGSVLNTIKRPLISSMRRIMMANTAGIGRPLDLIPSTKS